MSSSYRKLLKDIYVGTKEGEDPVSKFLLTTFGIITKNVGKNKFGWDIEVVGVDKSFVKRYKCRSTPEKIKKKFINKFGRTFEIKRDKVSDRTNNFFYEVWSNIKVHNPGCIATSKADVIVIVRKNEFLFLNRGYFISWLTYNLYFNTSLSKKWKRKTSKRMKGTRMKSTPISPNVRGILISIADIKKEVVLASFARP